MPIRKINIKQLQKQLDQFPQSQFGAIRKHDILTGIDIYCNENEEVLSIADGIIISMEIFTGEVAGSPWWNETKAVVVKSKEFFILYGELELSKDLFIGKEIKEGEILGTVIPVLKKYKNKNPHSMLHLEVYSQAPFYLIWNLNETKPKNLINPLEVLIKTNL